MSSCYFHPGLHLTDNRSNPYSTYRPVASVKPIKEFIGCYDNLDEFCSRFTDKINSNLLIPTEKDIDDLIARIKNKTGASKRNIKSVLYCLTQFSGYQSFGILNYVLSRLNIAKFGLVYKDGQFDFSSNSALNYLTTQKSFRSIFHRMEK